MSTSPKIENPPVTVVPATRRRRLSSMVYDGLLLLAVAFGVLMLWVFVGGLIQWDTSNVAIGVWIGRVQWLSIIVVLGVYFVWFWHFHGQTLAMRTWHLKVVTADGRNPSRARAWLRYLLAWPAVLFFGAGIIWSFIDRDGLFLHDRLSGTLVVRLPG